MTTRTCTICPKPHKANGFCATHDSEAKRRAAGAAKRTPGRRCELFPGCDRDYYAKGGCQAHYHQQRQGFTLHKITPRPERKSDAKKPGPKPQGSFPKGWLSKAEPTRGGSDKTPMQKEIGPVQPLGTRIIDAALAKLAEKDALDLADMLGLVA